MKKILYFAFFLMVTSGLVTGIAVIGYEWTLPYIEANRENAINESIALLYAPEDGYKRNSAQGENDYNELNRKYTDNSSGNISGIYEVLDANDDLVAILYNVNSQGRNGIMYAIIAVDPYTDSVISVVYYSHQETPDRGERYAREEETVKLEGAIIGSVEVDMIAGATTTWNAINDMFNIITIHYSDEEVHIDG